MIINEVPFVSNMSDDTHCLQAAYMSIALYFDSDFSIAMDEWSVLTGYEEGLGTWANAGLVWFAKHGYQVKHYEAFDFEAFIEHPKQYMIQMSGQQAGEWGFEHTNVPREIERIRRLLDANIVENREPCLADIKSGIDDGYLARVTVNAARLENTQGYEGHAVVITGYDNEHIVLHDPGLPALPNRRVVIGDFEAAWSDQIRELDLILRAP